VTAAFGYAPGRIGFGTDLPAGVARQWARWSLEPRHLLAEVEDSRDRFARWDRPTLFYSFTDDADFAPDGAVRAYLDVVAGAPVTHRRLGPADAGGAIGHFGFFRPRFEATLWAEATGWLGDVAAGRPPRLGPRDAGALFDLTMEEITRDLAYPGP
jgi:predicted alpha/beta hydrolase